MSGGFVPYHLRQNKAVERSVFIELLSRLSRSTAVPIQKYTYVGFAGPFSEDFKLAHAQLGVSKFVSLEMSESVLIRQKWNSPLSCIKYLHSTSKQFVDNFDASTPTVVWLDYASPSEVGSQLQELQFLVSKLANFDIVKVTLNANPRTLLGGQLGQQAVSETGLAVEDIRIAEARRRVGTVLPQAFDIEVSDVDKKGYPRLLLKATEVAIKKGMEGSKNSRYQLLSTFLYADSEHQMLTVTGIVLPDAVKSRQFLQSTGISRWPLATTAWGESRTDPMEITIPEMSLRERLFVDKQMPATTARRVLAKLGFQLTAGSTEKALAALESYRKFYRHFPHFSRVTI